MAVEEAQLESPLHEHAHTPHDRLVVIAWSGGLDEPAGATTMLLEAQNAITLFI